MNTLAAMIDGLLASAAATRADITSIVLAGNTVMEHIAVGLDPTPIGVAPFTPASLFGTDEQTPLGTMYFTPCIAGYVGGDITCGMMAVDMDQAEAPILFLDLGTNGEMALGSAGNMVSCATAAGPVFEGAGIEFGMPAYPGAISTVALEDGQLKLGVIDNAQPIGLCGSALIDTLALMLDMGAVDETGYIFDPDEAPDQAVPFLRETDAGTMFMLTDTIGVTQKDVRCFQLAKAAIYAGIQTMLDDRGLTCDDVSLLRIGGGFGAYLNLAHAATAGLFPAELLPCAKSLGNTCVLGASELLLNPSMRERITGIAQESDYLELSTSAAFNTFYVDAMAFE